MSYGPPESPFYAARFGTAVHELAHAFVAKAAGLDVHCVTLESGLGECHTSEGKGVALSWLVAVYVAGALAKANLVTAPRKSALASGQKDFRDIVKLGKVQQRTITEAIDIADRIITANWNTIRVAAHGLVRCGTLEGDKLDKVLARLRMPKGIQ